MEDRSDDPPHHERMLLPRSYISLLQVRKEGNVLFTDALRTFYLQLYDIKHGKEGNVLFNNVLRTFYLQLYDIRHGKEGNVLSNARHTVKDHMETYCCHIMGYSFKLTARDLLYAPFHIQDSTYHSLCYTSCGANKHTDLLNVTLHPTRL